MSENNNSSVGKTVGKVGGVATGLATVVIGVTAVVNSVKDFSKDEKTATPYPQQDVVAVVEQGQSQEEINQQLLAKLEQLETENRATKSTPKTTTAKTQSTQKESTNKQTPTVAQTTPKSNTANIKAERVSFAGRGLSGGIDINYTVVNKSSNTSYKNVVFRVEYLDANGGVLGTKDLKHGSEVFAPNQSKSVKMLGDNVRGLKTIRVRCIGATPVR